MRKIKIVFIISILFFMQICFAQRHVGNGGGEAELKLLQMIPELPLWAKACSENTHECGINLDFQSFLNINFNSIKVNFVNKHDNILKCINSEININRESLYNDIRQDSRKTNAEIALVLISSITECLFNFTPLNSIKIIPLSKLELNGFTAVFSNGKSDVLSSIKSKYSFHRKIQSLNGCISYKVEKKDNNNILIYCDNLKYLGFIIENETTTELALRYYIQD